MKRLGLALATVLALGSVANAVEFKEMTFENFRYRCKSEQPHNNIFCEAYIMGMAGQMMSEDDKNALFQLGWFIRMAL